MTENTVAKQIVCSFNFQLKVKSHQVSSQLDAWNVGTSYEREAHELLERRLGLTIRHNPSNSNIPDLEYDGIGLECKHRSGKYPTTSDHVRNGIMPKFYEGQFINRKQKQLFIAALDEHNQPIPKKRYWKRFVLMDNIAAPTRAATNLLNKLKIRIVTPFELCRWFASYLEPKNAVKKPIVSFHSFPLMRLFHRKLLRCMQLFASLVRILRRFDLQLFLRGTLRHRHLLFLTRLHLECYCDRVQFVNTGVIG